MITKAYKREDVSHGKLLAENTMNKCHMASAVTLCPLEALPSLSRAARESFVPSKDVGCSQAPLGSAHTPLAAAENEYFLGGIQDVQHAVLGVR